MQTILKHQPLILASQSPRRRFLLEQAGLCFDIIPSSIDEDSFDTESPEVYVKTLAQAKAGDISRRYPNSWVLGADTIVLIHKHILGKPGSAEAARTMLRQLSGQAHQVLTGYALCCQARGRTVVDVAATDVYFKNLTDEEIEWYIHTREPFDKAGAYAIQGIGAFLIRHINGSYTNVVGLPVCEVMESLVREGIVQYKQEER
jgi:septum formation protein